MAKKNNIKGTDFLDNYNNLKVKHPDAMLLFRSGDSYVMYKQDAIKVSSILGIPTKDTSVTSEKEQIKSASFHFHKLDEYLPKLIRAGNRIAICEDLDHRQIKKNEQDPNKNNNMSRRKREQLKQEEPVKSVKKTDEEKTDRDKKNEVKADTKTEKKQEQPTELKSETKKEYKPHEPQMVTANGEKVSHGHAYQNPKEQQDWYFTAKIDGKQLKPQKMDAEDLAAYMKKEITVPQLMERYYPTKLQPKVSEDAFKFPKQIAGPEGNISVDKFNVYKEKNEQQPDFGKYKFYVQMGETKMSAVASKQDLNAYFDRAVSPTQLIEKNFGERLHLKSAYENFKLPEGVASEGVRVAKDRSDNKWKVSVDLGENGKTSKQSISFDDGFSLFKTKTATREQIAAKYLNNEIKDILSNAPKLEKSNSLKV